MKSVSSFITFFICLYTAAIAQHRSMVVNLIKPYYAYQQSALANPNVDKLALFRQHVLGADSAFYQQVIGSRDSASLASFLTLVDGNLNGRIRRLEAAFNGQYAKAMQQITSRFPIARQFSNKVYVCLSLFSSNGQVRKLNTKYVVYYGLDVAAYFKAEHDDLLPLIEHEYFHLLQANLNPAVYDQINASFSSADTCPIYVHLFSEGLATYFPKHLNPSMALGKALFNDSLATQCKPIQGQLAGQLLRVIDSKDKTDLYQFFSIKSEKTTVPDRAAYYIGAEVTRRLLGKGYSYKRLLRLPPLNMRALVHRELRAMRDE
ncbi:hypothetical protein ACFSUS_01395 [Spirosoma soli]|uniref:DUF2268 domain-containing protein n=1 Tax=Spirosoma soli TaxID=1770529 RepID=A0ABW5LY60_9BACT